MGCHSSKPKDMASHLSSYKAACLNNERVWLFDLRLQQSISGFINTLAVGEEDASLSLESLRQLTRLFLEIHQLVVMHFKNHRYYNLNKVKLCEFFWEYSNSIHSISNFTPSLKSLLKYLEENLLPQIEDILRHFDEEGKKKKKKKKTSYNTSKSIQHFKAIDITGFNTNVGSCLFHSFKKEKARLEELRVMKSELDKKWKTSNEWRSISNVIFGATVSSVLVWWVVMVTPFVRAAFVVAVAGAPAETSVKVPYQTMKQSLTSNFNGRCLTHIVKGGAKHGLTIAKLSLIFYLPFTL